MKVFIAILSGLLITIGGYIVMLPAPESGSRFAMAGTESYVRILLLYAVMLFGVFSKAIHEFLPERERVNISKLLGDAVHSTAFIKAVVVSPIVFFSIYNITKSQPDDVIAILLAFQNGFFWQAVLQTTKAQVVNKDD